MYFLPNGYGCEKLFPLGIIKSMSKSEKKQSTTAQEKQKRRKKLWETWVIGHVSSSRIYQSYSLRGNSDTFNSNLLWRICLA